MRDFRGKKSLPLGEGFGVGVKRFFNSLYQVVRRSAKNAGAALGSPACATEFPPKFATPRSNFYNVIDCIVGEMEIRNEDL